MLENNIGKTAIIKIIEAERYREGAGILRIILEINGQKFRRVYENHLPVCWIEDQTNYIMEGKQLADLESIFKAWCLENLHIPGACLNCLNYLKELSIDERYSAMALHECFIEL